MALLISNENAAKVLTIADCIESIEEGVKEYYRGDATCRPRLDVWAPCGDPNGYYQWGSMEGTSKRHKVFATRIKSDIAYWSEYNGVKTQEKYCQRPGKFCGLILVFSLENGEPLAMAFCAVRKIRRIQVYSPTAKNREAYAREMSEKLKIEVDPVASPAEAVKGAEIVATCTDSIDPVLKGGWLEEGVLLTTVKGTTELDEETLKRVDIFFTFAPEAPSGPEQDKKTHAHRISGTHGAYVAGRPEDLARIPEVTKERKVDRVKIVSFKDLFEEKTGGRANDRQIISMTGNHIQGIQFASVGGRTVELIRERGLGREFPTDWLLQDIRN